MTTGVKFDRMPLLLQGNDDWDDDCEPDSDRRPSSIHPVWQPDLQRVDRWVTQIGKEEAKPILLVDGPSIAHRMTLYRCANAGPVDLQAGLVNGLTERFSKFRATGSIIPHQWDLLWNLLTLETLEVDGSLRLLVDQGLIFSEAFKAIWEARHRFDEGQDLQGFVSLISRWMTAAPLSSEDRDQLGSLGIESEPDTAFSRLDMLFFLATLARQNHLIEPTIVSLDGIESILMRNPLPVQKKLAVKELFDFCVASERWARIGSPIGFMLGYSGEYDMIEAFARAHEALGDKLRGYALV